MSIEELKDEAPVVIELVHLIGDNFFYAYCTYHLPLEITVKEDDVPTTRVYYPCGYKRQGLRQRTDEPAFQTTIEIAMNDSLRTILKSQDIRGLRVRLYRTLKDLDHTDPDNTVLIFDGSIEAWEILHAEDVLKLTLKEHTLIWDTQFPKSSYTYFCRFRFKSKKCGYTGPETTCSHTKDGCYIPSNFGGFPELPALQRRSLVAG